MIINNHLSGEKCPVPTDHPTLYVCTPFHGLVKKKQTIRLCRVHRITQFYCLSDYILDKSKHLLKAYAHKYNVNRSMEGKDHIHPTSGLKALLFSMLILDKFMCLDLEWKELRLFIITALAMTLCIDLHTTRCSLK